MNPTGKSYPGFDLYPIAPKRYRCDRCGHVSTQSTNHYQPTWSSGHLNVCPACPPWAKYPEFGGRTTWTCLDKPGDEDEVQQQADEILPKPPPKAAHGMPPPPPVGGWQSDLVDPDSPTGGSLAAV